MNTHKFVMVGADTDGVAFKKPDQSKFTNEERAALVTELNSHMDTLIRWEDDGVFKRQIVVKAKNYVLVDEAGKVKIKGSALKATTKEKALQRFISEIIDLIIKDRMDQIYSLYMRYALDIAKLSDITEWCSKKTVTKAVLAAERTTERRILEAIGDKQVQEGDKVYMFFRTPTELCLRENFEGTFDRDTLLAKLHDSLAIFETVIQIDLFPNFSLKRNIEMLIGPQPKPPKKPRTKSTAPTEVLDADLRIPLPESQNQDATSL